jgi:hypothetical protein
LGVGLTTPSRKKRLRYENLEDASEGFNKQTTTWIEDGGEELKTGTSGGML